MEDLDRADFDRALTWQVTLRHLLERLFYANYLG